MHLQKIAMRYWGQMTFHLLIQSKVGVQKEKGGPHNEHSEHSMPTGYRFYLKKAL